MKKNKVIFLDRDGTINYDFGYVHEREKLVFLPNAIKGLKKLYDHGYILLIITNQSGIGRGYFSRDEYNNFTSYMLQILEKNGVKISKVYCCPHIDSDNCNCRKPKLGLFYQAIEEFNVDLEKSYSIGDKERDLEICKYTNIKGIILSKYNKKFIKKNDLLEAADYILK